MFPTLLCGVLTLAVSVRYAVQPEKRFVPLLVSLNAMTLIAGLLGFVTGLISLGRYVSQQGKLDPAVPFIGVGEALHNVGLALLLMMLAIVATSVGAFRQTRAQPA
ncbi:MAG TPA: hypothetical protein VK447_03920 [Myxococcaceae bacterium]|nr:hypothetical protein [Myxococcaceae bacterium]